VKFLKNIIEAMEGLLAEVASEGGPMDAGAIQIRTASTVAGTLVSDENYYRWQKASAS
jgi:hypothetical protein